MNKTDEFFARDIKRSVELGKANAEHVRNMRNWCKHFRVEMVSSGLIAQMYQLPVGLHKLACPYVDGEIGSSNLPWAIPDFLIANCLECEHHDSNGDTSWGERIIEEHRQRLQKRQEAEQERQEHLRKIRERLRELPRKTRDTSQIDERQILTFVEELFSDDKSRREESAVRLVQSARIGAELFPPITVDILLDQSALEEFAELCLPICAELAGRRLDLVERLRETALLAVRRNVCPELAAQVLVRLGKEVEYPLETTVIKNLVTHQHHVMPLGGWTGEPPSYPSSTTVLLKCYDADAASVTAPLRSFLKINNKYARIHTCGAIALIQQHRPQLGIDLLADLVSSFELNDDPYEDSADGKTASRIVVAFRHAPRQVDEYLVWELSRRRPAVQGEIVGVYRKLAHNRQRRWRTQRQRPCKDKAPAETEIAITRLLEFIKNDTLDLEVRHKAAQGLETACRHYTQAVFPYLDSILGYCAILESQSNPPPEPPHILLPGEESNDPVLTNLDEYGRQQKWYFLKHRLLECIKQLAEDQPAKVGDVLIDCYEGLDTSTHAAFKSALVELLGDVGKDYSLHPRVLPLLMRALMDYDSQQVRGSAIRAYAEMYRHSDSGPPRNIVDVILVHLRDTYVIIHQAAVYALQSTSRWLDRSQAAEALAGLWGVLNAYRNDPFEMKDICDAILTVVYHFPDLQHNALGMVLSVFPTREQLVDEDILEEIIRLVEPDDRAAKIIVRQIAWCIVNYRRDSLDDSEFHARSRAVQWLGGIPRTLYAEMRAELVDASKQIAARDIWESFHFAALFSQHEDYLAEEAVLKAALDALPAEQRHDSTRRKLENLIAVAKANSHLCNGEANLAQQIIATIREIPELCDNASI